MIADIYELAPMQRGMLFHTLHAPESQAYHNQLSCRLTGRLSPALLADSWRYLIARHPVLRTSFQWEELESPVGVVLDKVDLPWHEYDWRQHSEAERQARWDALCRDDRARGFQLDRAPLMRCYLVYWHDDSYRFLWSHHHLLLDGWCLGIVLDELFQVYSALRDHRPPALHPVRPYRDFILWLQGQDQAAAEAFWQSELDGFAEPTSPVTVQATQEPVGRSGTGVRQELRAELSADLSTALVELARRMRITPSTLVLGAWAILLRRYTGSTDVLFGTTVSGRSPDLSGIDRMLGVFINTLPVRVAVVDESPVSTWLPELQRQQAEREHHGHVALSDIRRHAQLAADVSLFDSLIIFMNYPLDASATQAFGDVTMDAIEVFDQADLPLTLQVVPGPRWTLEVLFDDVRFDSEAMTRLIGHIRRILENFVAHPDGRVCEIDMITQSGRERLMHVWNHTQAPLDASLLVIDRFERQVAQHPDRLAAIDDNNRITYGQLNEAANKIADALRDIYPVGADDLVAVVAERSIDMLAGILAIWKCGAAYVPIDASYPDERILTIIGEAGARVVLTDAGLLDDGLTAQIAALAPLVSFEHLLERGTDRGNPARTLEPHHLAYVMFTSGSTGKPKGAMVERIGMLNHVLAKIEDLEIDQDSVLVQNASHCFDVSVWQFFCALLTGGVTTIYGNDLVLQPDGMIARLRDERVTIVEVVPSYLSIFLDQIPPDIGFPHLEYMVVTGETVNPELVRRWFARFPDIPMMNAYGPTEASDDITHHFMAGPPEGASIPIGKAIRNSHIYIVDEHGNLCPEGVKGEICVSGICVGRGYINDDARTSAVFSTDPFRSEPGVRLYHTGDVGCFLADGTILFFGRKDHQIKIRGFRIELGEIESALTRLPELRDAVVIDRRDDGHAPYLCAYLTTSGSPPEPGQIASSLGQILPDHMIPSAFVFLDALPLTRNGKVDRKALPAPDMARMLAPRGYVAPRDGNERALAEIWQEALGVEQIGIHDNFFALGGDSILIMRVVSQALKAGISVTSRMVFEHQTLAELSAAATEATPAHREQGLVTGTAPLTSIQRRFFASQYSDPHHYNQSLALDVPPDLESERLRRALRHVVEHHDVLRARFPEPLPVDEDARDDMRDAIWEIRESIPPVPVSIHALDDTSDDEHNELIRQIAAQEQSSLNLGDGPLLRALLFSRGSSRPARLVLICHHLVMDGYSWQVLVEDLNSAYTQLGNGDTVRLPAKSTSYLAWARELQIYADSQECVAGASHWRELARRTIARLPRDHSDPEQANTVSSIDTVTMVVDAETTTAFLSGALAAYNARANDVLIAALAATVAPWSQSGQLLVELEGHGRVDFLPGVDVSRTVGWFTAIYPVVVNVPRSGSEGELIMAVKEELRATPHDGISYDVLRFSSADSEIRAALAGMARPEVLFNYHGRIDGRQDNTSWRPLLIDNGPERAPGQLRSHLLEINCYVIENQLQVVWSYSRAIHTRATVERLAASYVAQFSRLVHHCLEPDAGAYTPSDFPAARVDRVTLDALIANLSSRRAPAGPASFKSEVSDVYELSPVQQGMLFHCLYDPGSPVYFNQLTFRVDGELDQQAFVGAWRHLVARHPILRTSFHWEGLDKPLQVVHRTAPLDVTHLDWRGLSEDERTEKWQVTLTAERARGFALDEPSPMRFVLIREGDRAYRVIWSRHHLLLDGWSSALLLQELHDSYRALRQDGALPEPSVRPYRDHVRWLQAQDAAAASDFWRTTLAGFSAPIELLVQGAHEPEASPGYAELASALSDRDSARLAAFARERAVTVNTLVQGAWAVLLGRYSGEQDVVFGTISSGRDPRLTGSDRMIGVFINTLPVRAIIDDEKPIVAWLRDLQAHLAEREHYSYSSLVEVTRSSDVPSKRPLFESIVIFENYPMEVARRAGDDEIRITDTQAFDPNNYALTLVATPGERFALKMMYDRGRFAPETMSRMLGHFENLLRDMVDSPDRSLGSLSILSREERAQLVARWQPTHAPLDAGDSVIVRFAQAARANPDATAVVHGSQRVTYAALNAGANRLARVFGHLGSPGTDQIVAIIAERSLDLVTAMLATWKCGAAYLPIDPGFPAQRVQTIVDNARPALVLVQEDRVDPDLVAALRSTCTVALLGQALSRSGAEDESDPPSAPEPGDLAYVIYTSGSTGAPKGVMVTQHGMLNHIISMVTDMQLGPESRVGQTASHCFDISVWQFFGALVAGGSIVIYSDQTLRDLDKLAQGLARDRITALQFVPSYLSMLVAELARRPVPPSLPDLAVVASIGEALDATLVQRWFELFPAIRLINTYGPTEASDSVTHHIMDSYPESGVIPIGRAIDNMSVYVLDARGNPCPAGIRGEICIAGKGVARGYLNDPERTAEVFTRDSLSEDPQARMYWTGDIGCYTPQGELLFLGRGDNQVKIRGHRIELGEIEHHIARLDEVRDALVLARDHDGAGRRLCAYVILSGDSHSSEASIGDALRAHLPAYMIPDAILILDEFPRLPNGKIDRKRLPEPVPAHDATTHTSPRTATERRLVVIWQDVLSTAPISTEDSFFALGGDSLKAIQMVSRIQREFDVSLSFTELFDRDTVRGLAAHIARSAHTAMAAIEPVAPADDYATSHAQKRIWLTTADRQGSVAYHITGAYYLMGGVDAAAFRAALHALLQRHESLRTQFLLRGGELRQRIVPIDSVDLPLRELDLCRGSDAEARALVAEHAARPFDLDGELPVRGDLFRLSEDRYLFAVTLHHIISDAWSLQILVGELVALYAAFRDGIDNPLPPLAIQYRDYAVWHNAAVRSDEMVRHRDYWLGKLAGPLPRLTLPTDAGPGARSGRAGHCTVAVDRELFADLTALALRSRVSLYTIVVSAIYALLYRYSGQGDIAIGTQIAGREHPWLEEQIGCYVNTLVIRAQPDAQHTIAELIAHVGVTLREAWAHQDYPYDLLVQDIESTHESNRGPLFDVQVDYVPAVDRGLTGEDSDLRFRPIDTDDHRAKFALSFLAEEHGDHLTLHLLYDSGLFRTKTGDRLRDSLERVLVVFASDDTCTLAEIPLMTSSVNEPEASPISIEVKL